MLSRISIMFEVSNTSFREKAQQFLFLGLSVFAELFVLLVNDTEQTEDKYYDLNMLTIDVKLFDDLSL